MTRAAQSWPKAYIISLYAAAVEHGYVWVQPITEERATSLLKSFYNARRRSDTTNKSWMRDEYHLCTFGRWEQHGDDPTLGRIPVLFSALPDGEALPEIIPATPEEKAARPLAAPLAPSREEPQDFLSEVSAPPSKEELASRLTLGADFDAAGFVASMKKKVID